MQDKADSEPGWHLAVTSVRDVAREHVTTPRPLSRLEAHTLSLGNLTSNRKPLYVKTEFQGLLSHADDLGFAGSCKCPFRFSSSRSDLAITMRQATADAAHTEIRPCARDHVHDRPIAGGPGNDARSFPCVPLIPQGDDKMFSKTLPPP